MQDVEVLCRALTTLLDMEQKYAERLRLQKDRNLQLRRELSRQARALRATKKSVVPKLGSLGVTAAGADHSALAHDPDRSRQLLDVRFSATSVSVSIFSDVLKEVDYSGPADMLVRGTDGPDGLHFRYKAQPSATSSD
jgi:hypothetical protein